MSFEKSFENNNALYNAALNEFIDQGYEQASINKILQTANMSKGQFYYHFKNKEALYFALIEISITKKQAFMAGLIKPEDLQQDIFTIFQILTRYGLEFANTYPKINQFAQSFVREQGNAIYNKALAQFNFENNDAMTIMIERAHEKGEFNDEFPLPFIKKTITYLFAHAADLIDLGDSTKWEVNLNYLIAFMKSGLAKE